jgi:amicyanin
MRIPGPYLLVNAISSTTQGAANMELASRQSKRTPGPTQWRLAALAAAASLTLAACGASAAGTTSTATTSTPASAVPSATTGGTPAAAATADVGIVNFKFTPPALMVKVGTTVVWTNKDSIAHTVNFMTGGINSNTLNQNDQFTHTFTTPGTYDYICSIHPFMHGSVTVTA